MKKLIILAVLLSSTLTMTIKAQDEAFEKLADTKGVEVVYISKALLGMMPNMKAQGEINGMNIGNIINKLNSVTILSGETKDAVKAIKTEMKNILRTGGYEQIMYVKDDDSKTVFYTKKGNSKDADLSELLMVSDEDGFEISVIRITGNISTKDIQAITSKSGKK